MPTIIVFCHLRWDFVYQRPQQLLTRLAQHYRVVFVEEPVYDSGSSFIEKSTPVPNVTVCRPHTPSQTTGFHDDQIPLLQPLLATLIAPGEQPIVWFYTPMALPLLQELHACLVVYDCMDELAAFKNSPKQLLQRESALLNLADLVFAGGPSLYMAKRERHGNAHCLPSSVDVRHFERALVRDSSHPDQNGLARPRLGFYGVIDERFDSALIAELADAHPEWQLVLVGPVIKIDRASLPQRANIHYLGQRTYDELPAFLAGWDVCLMPFAINEATRFISPTKVLEYMAAELPIVSTPIADVARPYGHVVAIADDAEQFVAACEAALEMSDSERAEMAEVMRAAVVATSWDVTADAMRSLMTNAPPRRAAPRFAPVDGTIVAAGDRAKVNPLRSPSSAQKVQTVVVGAGPTGLSASYHLGEGAVLLEKNASVGGWCRSIADHGFTFDYAGHIMFSNDPYVLKMYDMLLGPNLHWQDREAWVYSKNVYTRYPFQSALHGLPPNVIKECIVGAVEARFGNIAGDTAGAPCNVNSLEDCCADGTADVANAASFAPRKREAQNFEEFIYKVWGRGIARHFAIPYNKKLWTVPLSEMETSWLGGRVPLPDLEDIIEGALEPVGKPVGPNARFAYPLSGGFQSLMSGFLPHIKGRIEMNALAAQLQPREHLLVMADGRRYRYDHLVSTMPLPELVKLIGADAPEDVRAAASGLRHISVRCVNLGVAREHITDKHWIYYPEETIFHRIFVQGNASPHCNPPGGFGLTCEISYSPWKPLPVDGQALIERCIADCVSVGMLRAEDRIITANLVDMPYAYVVYDQARASNVATVKDWLARYDIILAGRYSEWEYYNSDHAFLAGKKAAEAVLRLRADAAKAASAD
jgi:protoporphyrinogen oxidase/glycosyltransferase involved in cell wall biosynthesis